MRWFTNDHAGFRVKVFLLALCLLASFFDTSWAHREQPTPSHSDPDSGLNPISVVWVIAHAKTLAQLRPHRYGTERDCLAALRLLRIVEARCVEAR